MALEVKLGITGYDHKTKLVTLTDDTGNYSSPSNEGGWGAPNVERVNFALVIVEEVIVGRNYKQSRIILDAAPTTVATWNLSISKDGVYGYNLVALGYFADTLSIGVEFDDSYIVVADEIGFWDGATFTPLTANDELPLSDISTGRLDTQDIFIRKFAEEYLMKSVLNSREFECLCPVSDYRIEAVLNSASVAYLNGDYIKAQEDIIAFNYLKEQEHEEIIN